MARLLTLSAGLSLLAMVATAAFAEEPKKGDTPPVLDFTMKSLDGEPVDLSRYRGKVVMIVNVASECGATPQYEPLQALYETYKDKGFVVLGFPCNQFGAQEPGDAKEIRTFCTDNYGVTFDMFSKIDVNGDNAAPLYKFLTSEQTNPGKGGKIAWNFEKFLISREGKVVARYKTAVEPDSEEVVKAIEAELKKG
jgi:glutathione peroxidase